MKNQIKRAVMALTMATVAILMTACGSTRVANESMNHAVMKRTATTPCEHAVADAIGDTRIGPSTSLTDEVYVAAVPNGPGGRCGEGQPCVKAVFAGGKITKHREAPTDTAWKGMTATGTLLGGTGQTLVGGAAVDGKLATRVTQNGGGAVAYGGQGGQGGHASSSSASSAAASAAASAASTSGGGGGYSHR